MEYTGIGRSADLIQIYRGAPIHLLFLPVMRQVGGIIDASRRQQKRFLVSKHADRLKGSVPLLIMIDAFLCLGDGAVLDHVAEVVGRVDAVMTRPFCRTRRCLIDYEDRGCRGLGEPIHGQRPLDFLGENTVTPNVGIIALVGNHEEAGQLWEKMNILQKLINGLVFLDRGAGF